MNAKRRKALKAVISRLGDLDRLRGEIRDQLEEIMDDEQEALDSMPEALQDGKQGGQMQEYIDTMTDALYDLNMIDLESMGQQLEEIIG